MKPLLYAFVLTGLLHTPSFSASPTPISIQKIDLGSLKSTDLLSVIWKDKIPELEKNAQQNNQVNLTPNAKLTATMYLWTYKTNTKTIVFSALANNCWSSSASAFSSYCTARIGTLNERSEFKLIKEMPDYPITVFLEDDGSYDLTNPRFNMTFRYDDTSNSLIDGGINEGHVLPAGKIPLN